MLAAGGQTVFAFPLFLQAWLFVAGHKLPNSVLLTLSVSFPWFPLLQNKGSNSKTHLATVPVKTKGLYKGLGP